MSSHSRSLKATQFLMIASDKKRRMPQLERMAVRARAERCLKGIAGRPARERRV